MNWWQNVEGGTSKMAVATLAGISVLITFIVTLKPDLEIFPDSSGDAPRFNTPPSTAQPPPDVQSPGYIPEAPEHFILNMAGGSLDTGYIMDQLIKGGVIGSVDEVSSVIVTSPGVVQEIKYHRMFGGILSPDAQEALQEAYNDRNDLGLGDKVIITDRHGGQVVVIPTNPAAPDNTIRQ